MGHELNPHLYSANEEGIWALETTLDNSGSGDGAKKKSNTQFGKAMSMWGGKKLRSSSDASGGGKNEINTKHDRPIFELRPYAPTIAEEGDAGGKVTKFTSVGMDGKLVVWDVSDFV